MQAHVSLGITTTALLFLIGGCASTQPAGGASSGSAPVTQERALARYSSYAGPPLPSFTWLGHLDSWEALGKDRLVVYTSGLDSVVVDNAAAGAPWQCPIEEIRQVDVRRMKASGNRAPAE